MVRLSDEEKLAKIKSIVDATDEHRNRSKRESWVAIKAVLDDVQVVALEPAPAKELETPEEAEDSAGQEAEVEEPAATQSVGRRRR